MLSALAVLVAAIPAVGQTDEGSAPLEPAAVEPLVADQLTQQDEADFWVVFDGQPDLTAAADIDDWAERGQFVHDRLVQHARDSQADLTAQLRAQGVAFDSYWISNRVLVHDGDQQTLDAALAQDGVTQVQADEPVQLPDPINEDDAAVATADAVEWGIENIRASHVWSQLDVRGEGIVVGNVDSGVQFSHPALVNQYRGSQGDAGFDHNYNWWDPSDVCAADEPCDNTGHGTHTMGTMVGDDGAGNQIGVAPAANWIAAKGCEGRTCSLAALLSAGQFMLAPTDLAGDNPRPELRPHVVNNSWGGSGGRDFYDHIVDAWVAAGMFPVFSNGNSGPSCGTAGSPGDGPNAYSAGAYDSDNEIASFSSRGPGRDGMVKPNVSAPGVRVRSSIPGDRYALGSGTSMAAPHLAGTVALMWSASGAFGDIDGTRAALDVTAIDTDDLTCGGTPTNNNVYGQGRLDALGATLRVATDSGIGGRIMDAASDSAIANARVSVVGNGLQLSTNTGADGRYQLNLLPGTYDVEVSRFAYESLSVTDVTVKRDKVSTVDAALELSPTGTVAGSVTLDESGLGVPGVTIYADSEVLATTDADGSFRVAAPIGTHRLAASHDMFRGAATQDVTLAEGDSVVADFVMPCGDVCTVEGLWVDRADGPASSSDVARATEFSPDGATVYVTGESPGDGTSTDFETIAYDQATGERHWKVRYDGPAHGRDAGYGLGVSPDGSSIYVSGPSAGVGTDTDFAIVSYDAATGDQQWVARYDGPLHEDDAAIALDVSPDGATIFVTGYSRGENFWDYATVAVDATSGDLLWTARYDGLSTETPVSVDVAPDGATVSITGHSRSQTDVSNDRDYATITYDAATGEELWVARYSAPTTGTSPSDIGDEVRVSPDSSMVIVTGRSRTASNTDIATIAYDRWSGEELWVARYDGPAGGTDMAFAMEVNPDGSALYVTGRSTGSGTSTDYVTVAYDPATGNELWTARYDGPISSIDIAQAVDVSPDGTRVFVAGHSRGPASSADYATVAYDAATGEQLWLGRYDGPAHNFDSVNVVRVSPDSTRVVVAGFSFGVGSNRDYAVIAYDAAASPDIPVFVPWDLRVQRDLVAGTEPVDVRANVTNVGVAGGDHTAVLRVDGQAHDEADVTVGSGQTRQVEWSLALDEPGRYEVGVDHLTAPLWLVGCDTTVTGTHRGTLTVTDGVTCLAEGAQVTGPVEVQAGAGLVSTGAAVDGRIAARDATVVMVHDSQVGGPVTVVGTSGGLELIDNRLPGNVRLDDNTTEQFAIVVAGNRVGSLSCTGNTPAPVNQGQPNEVRGQQSGQCADL